MPASLAYTAIIYKVCSGSIVLTADLLKTLMDSHICVHAKKWTDMLPFYRFLVYMSKC